MRRIEKRGHELRRKILLPLQRPPTECFSPDDIKTRSRTSREQARSKIWPVFKSRLGLLAFFVFFFLQGGEILVSKIRDRRIDRGNKTLVRLRDAFRFYFEIERNKRANEGRQKKIRLSILLASGEEKFQADWLEGRDYFSYSRGVAALFRRW